MPHRSTGNAVGSRDAGKTHYHAKHDCSRNTGTKLWVPIRAHDCYPSFIDPRGILVKTFEKTDDRWPLPKFDDEDQPHFLFIITPPYSGSTALSELLNTSHRTMVLHHKGEGQWLVPGMHEKDKWKEDKKLNYPSVKATWLNRYQQVKRLTQNIDVVIEKSPPNMMRMSQIASQFRSFSYIANNRDPYANCASILYRRHDAEKLSSESRKEVLGKLANSWIKKSTKVKELVGTLNAPLLTYEAFCQNPSSVISILNLPDGVADSINPDAKVIVKDYAPQPISNQNNSQISKLSNEEIDHISGLLKSSTQLLDFFGYQLMQ